jgi:hypothetical protein
VAEKIFLGRIREPLSLGVLLGLGRSNYQKRNGNDETLSFENATQIEKYTELEAASLIGPQPKFLIGIAV